MKSAFRGDKREIALNTVKIDFLRFGDGVFVHEIKKSKKFEKHTSGS